MHPASSAYKEQNLGSKVTFFSRTRPLFSHSLWKAWLSSLIHNGMREGGGFRLCLGTLYKSTHMVGIVTQGAQFLLPDNWARQYQGAVLAIKLFAQGCWGLGIRKTTILTSHCSSHPGSFCLRESCCPSS